MKKILGLTVTLLVTAVVASICASVNYDKIYSEWKAAPVRELKQRGDECLNQERMDSALMYYAMSAEKYRSDMPDSDKSVCAGAYNNAGYIYFYYRNDYSSSYTCLLKAQEISDEANDSTIYPCIYLNMGNIYINYNDYKASAELYRKAFHASVKVKDMDILLTSFCNLANLAVAANDAKSVMKEVKTLRELKIPPMPMLNYTHSVCNATECVAHGDYNGAIEWLRKSLDQIDTKLTPERYRLGSMNIMALIYTKTGNHAEAVRITREVERESRGQALDLQAEACNHLSDYYTKLGNASEAMQWHTRSLQLSDSLFRSQQYGRIRDMKSTFEIGKIADKMRESENRRQTMTLVLFIVGFGAAIVLVMAILLKLKNNRLQRSNRDLFRRNEEVMRMGENERRRSDIYERKIAEYERHIAELRHNDTPETQPETQPEQKYQGSTLDDYAKQQLLSRINAMLDNVDEISVTDFSVDRLARLVESNSKYVSQVINEAYGKNFNTLLGEKRVQQACARLSDTDSYGNVTIEAIASGLGFKSRSNFVTVFKRVTGLTPSEYKRISTDKMHDE